MRYEFIGSLLIFAFCALLPNRRKFLINALLFGTLAFAFFPPFDAVLYCAFFAGSTIPMWPVIRSRAALILMFFVGVFLSVFDGSAFFSFLRFPVGQYSPLPLIAYTSIYDVIGSILLFYLALNLEFVGRYFAKPIFGYLGKISYSVYAIHTLLLFSLSCWLQINLEQILWLRGCSRGKFCCDNCCTCTCGSHFSKNTSISRASSWRVNLAALFE